MVKNIQWNALEAMPDDRAFEAYHNRSEHWYTASFHAHEYYELYFYVSGATDIVLENYIIKMSPGDFVIFPPGYMHRAAVRDSDALYERAYIYVDRDCLRSMSTADFNLLGILENCVHHSQFCFSLGKGVFSECMRRIDEIIAASTDTAPAQLMMNRCRCNMLLATLCSAISGASEARIGVTPTRMNELIRYIQDNISEDMNLDTLAERFYVSKYHLLHEFKMYTNTSLYQYILSKRIIYAKLLLQSGLSPGSVYAQCGFSDYSCFYKSFRKETGLSPQKYLTLMRTTGHVPDKQGGTTKASGGLRDFIP